MATHGNCPYCGTKVNTTARYCDTCGTPLAPVERAPEPKPSHPHSRVAVWLFVVVLLLTWAGGALGGFRFRVGRWPWAAAVVGPGPAAGNDDGPSGSQAQPEADPRATKYLRAVVALGVRGAQGSKTGSGFLIDADGHIVTSAHVVEGHRGCVSVVDDNGTTHQGSVVEADSRLDVALLHVPTLRQWPDRLPLRAVALKSGDHVYALGSPKGSPSTRFLPAEVEEVGVQRRIDDRPYRDLVAIRGAVVNHGASGSPLIHQESGQAVAIMTAAAETPEAWAVPFSDEVVQQVERWVSQPTPQRCQSAANAQTTSLVLSAILPLSGPLGVWGNDMADGMELALRDMEGDLRKAGYAVSLARYDDRGQASRAEELAQQVAADPDVVGVVGSFTSNASAAVAGTLAQSGTVMVAPTAGAEELTAQGWPHFNRLVASNARLEAAAAWYLQSRLKASSVLVLVDGEGAQESRRRSFEASAQIISLPIAGTLKLDGLDAKALKQKVQDSKADAVYVVAAGAKAIQAVQWLRQEGLTLPVVGGPELFNVAFEGTVGSQWRSLYFTHFSDGGDERFARHYESTLGKPTRGYGIYGYYAARVILDALVRYGDGAPGKVPPRAELARLVRATRNQPGWSASAQITIDGQTGENQAARVYLYEWVDGHHQLRESIR